MKTTTRLGIILAISTAFFAVEVSMGFRTKSLALIADAFHVLNDIVSFAIAFVAAYVQGKEYRPSGFTYALHRAENVGAFFNGVFLLALALSIFLQSLERFINIEAVEDPLSMLIVGCVGLAMNLLSAGIIGHDHGHGHGHNDAGSKGHGHSHDAELVAKDTVVVAGDEDVSGSFSVALEERNIGDIHASHNHARVPPTIVDPHGNLGVMAVFIHLLGDAINNIGVIAAALIMWRTHSHARFYADPAVSLIISLIIFASAIPLTMRSGRILLEASPIHIDLNHITEDLLALNNVLSIHDLHVWQLSQTIIVASLHVEVPLGTTLTQWGKIEGRLRECMSAYGVSHLTVGPEVSSGTVNQSSTGDIKVCTDLLGCSSAVACSPQGALRNRA